jgi:hypothetical protein
MRLRHFFIVRERVLPGLAEEVLISRPLAWLLRDAGRMPCMGTGQFLVTKVCAFGNCAERRRAVRKKSPPKELFASEALACEHKENGGTSSRRLRSVTRATGDPFYLRGRGGFPFPLLPRVSRLKEDFSARPPNPVDNWSVSRNAAGVRDGGHRG